MNINRTMQQITRQLAGNLVQTRLQGIENNPMFQRAKQMAEGRSGQELEQIARNLCEQRGIKFDDAFNKFKNSVGIN